MERIKLTKNENNTLRGLLLGKAIPHEGVSKTSWNSALRSLQRKGLVRAAFIEGGSPEDAKLTTKGKDYLREFPSLRNPIRLEISSVTFIIAAIVSIIMLFIAYTHFK